MESAATSGSVRTQLLPLCEIYNIEILHGPEMKTQAFVVNWYLHEYFYPGTYLE